MSFTVWESKKDIYIIDGHHRYKVLDLLEKEGVNVPAKLPCTFIDCKDKREACKLVLTYSSIYAKVQEEGLYEFLNVNDFDFESLKNEIDIPNIDFEKFELGYFKEQDEEKLNDVPELQEKAISKLGDLFLIDGKHRVLCGDSTKEKNVNLLMDGKKADVMITDPPYGLSFMGKKWDYDVPSEEIWRECLRVLKHGGYLLAFAGTRTQHRMAVRIEDAGFEIRDMIAWVYGSGFPKSLSIGKAVNSLETKEWLNIGKAIDNININDYIEAWKSNSNNVKIVETQSLKNQIIAGQDTQSESFVVLNVAQNNNQESSNLLVSFVEQNLNEAPAINTKTNTALLSVETEIRQLQNNVKSAEQQLQNQNHKSWNIFTAQCDVREWLTK